MNACTHCLRIALVLTMGLALFAFQGVAQELQRITLRFSLTTGDSLAPADSIAGTIIYTAGSSLAPIHAFESIDLTIAGHRYSVGEIGFWFDPVGDSAMIGGLINGVRSIRNDSTDDFWLRWHPGAGSPIDFSYGTSRTPGIWPRACPGFPLQENFSAFTIGAEPVPEPTSATLLLVGAALAWWGGRRTPRGARRDDGSAAGSKP